MSLQASTCSAVRSLKDEIATLSSMVANLHVQVGAFNRLREKWPR